MALAFLTFLFTIISLPVVDQLSSCFCCRIISSWPWAAFKLTLDRIRSLFSVELQQQTSSFPTLLTSPLSASCLSLANSPGLTLLLSPPISSKTSAERQLSFGISISVEEILAAKRNLRSTVSIRPTRDGCIDAPLGNSGFTISLKELLVAKGSLESAFTIDAAPKNFSDNLKKTPKRQTITRVSPTLRIKKTFVGLGDLMMTPRGSFLESKALFYNLTEILYQRVRNSLKEPTSILTFPDEFDAGHYYSYIKSQFNHVKEDIY